jgi:tetratricopeptide (TPR) repeat protein
MHNKARGRGKTDYRLRTTSLCVLLALAPLPAYPVTDHLEKSLELVSQGDLNGAEKEARLALNDPLSRARAWATLGAIRLGQAKYEESEGFLNTALQLDPRLVGARINLGNVCVLRGKADQARNLFKSVLKIDPGNLNARFDLAKLEAQSGNYSASLEVAKPVIRALRDFDEGLLVLATDYLGLQRIGPARALVSDWKALRDVAQDVAVDLALLFVKKELAEEAIEVLEKAKSNGRASYDLFYTLAGCYLSKGDVKGASANYELALGFKQSCVPCLLQIARVARQEGDSEKALAYLIRAKEAEPENPEILFEFGKVCLERDLLKDAIPALQRAVELRPEDASYAYVLSSAYVGKNQYKDARELLDNLLKKRPDDPILNYVMGAVLFLEANLDDATRYLKKSIAIQPDQIAAHYYLGLVADRKVELDQAVSIFRDLLQRHPDHAPSYEALGGVLFKQRKYGEAQQVLEKALQLDPDSVKAHYQLGVLLGRVGKMEESSKHKEIAQKLEAEGRRKSAMDLRILTAQ